jgi:hypothetical protein
MNPWALSFNGFIYLASRRIRTRGVGIPIINNNILKEFLARE